jgi:Na+/melibiose symporter-like transporter
MFASSKSKNQLNRSQTVVYALPAIALAVPMVPAFVLLPSFYANDLGLGLAVVGFTLLLVRLLDVISDPIIGYLAEHVQAGGFQRRLPIFIGMLVAGPALVYLFDPPVDASASYLFASASFLFLGWTFIQIPYLSWAVELEPGYIQRTRLTGARETFSLLGILIAGALLYILSDNSVADQIKAVGWLTVILGSVTLTAALIMLPEISRHVQHGSQNLKNLTQNKLAVRLLGAWFINGLANGLPAVCFPLFLTYVLGDDGSYRNALLLAYFLTAIAAIPLWLALQRRWSKHRVWCFAMIATCLAFTSVPLLSSGDFIGFAVICLITGAGLGADLALPPSIQADVADWDRARFRVRRTGILFSFWNMSTKLSLALAVGVAFPLLEWAGLNNSDGATDFSQYVLVVIYAVIPIVLKIVAVALMWKFPIGNKQHQAIERQLMRRLKGTK